MSNELLTPTETAKLLGLKHPIHLKDLPAGVVEEVVINGFDLRYRILKNNVKPKQEVAVGPKDALISYEAGCKALSAARTAIEVMNIIDLSKAKAVLEDLAGNERARNEAEALRDEADRKLGQMMSKQKEVHGFSQGGRPPKTGLTQTQFSGEAKQDENNRVNANPVNPGTLKEAGIGKAQAQRSRVAAQRTEEEHAEKQARILSGMKEKRAKRKQQHTGPSRGELLMKLTSAEAKAKHYEDKYKALLAEKTGLTESKAKILIGAEAIIQAFGRSQYNEYVESALKLLERREKGIQDE